MFYRIT